MASGLKELGYIFTLYPEYFGVTKEEWQELAVRAADEYFIHRRVDSRNGRSQSCEQSEYRLWIEPSDGKIRTEVRENSLDLRCSSRMLRAA